MGRLGCKVTRASDGAEAVSLAAAAARGEAPGSTVAMDMKLPGLDGFEAARAIAPSSAILASGASRRRDDRQCDARSTGGASEAAGIDEFLAKPYRFRSPCRDDRAGLAARGTLTRLRAPRAPKRLS